MNFQTGLETIFNHYNQFLDKSIWNSSAGERFNRAKPQYLIKRKKRVKRSKNNRTFESKLHPSANTRNNEKEKGKQTTLISTYGLFTQSKYELGVRYVLFNGMKTINTKVQKVYFAKKQLEIPVLPLQFFIILCQNNHGITYTYQWLRYVKQKWINMCRDKTQFKKSNKLSIKYESVEH